MLLQNVTFSCFYDFKIMFLRFLFYTWDYRICPSMKFVDKPSNIFHRSISFHKTFLFFYSFATIRRTLVFCCEYLLFFINPAVSEANMVDTCKHFEIESGSVRSLSHLPVFVIEHLCRAKGATNTKQIK